MLWQDDPPSVPSSSDAVDLVFRIDCQRLPVDHAAALAQAIVRLAPWLAQSPFTAVQPIRVAGSQNGWERPADGELLLSRRTRLLIRVANELSDQSVDALCGQSLDIAGHSMTIVSARPRALTPSATLLARNVCYKGLDDPDDEQQFSDAVVQNCQALGFQPTRLLCGLQQQLVGAGEPLHTRSVLLANVPPTQSLTLQRHGLGDQRLIGCGVLIPNKDISAVNAEARE